jgi:hypothetical protein
MNSRNLQVSDANEAVEARGAIAKQRAMSKRESSFFELAAPSATRLADVRRTLHSSPGATTALEASRRDVALSMWRTQLDSKHAAIDLENEKLWHDDESTQPEFQTAVEEIFDVQLLIGSDSRSC